MRDKIVHFVGLCNVLQEENYVIRNQFVMVFLHFIVLFVTETNKNVRVRGTWLTPS